MIKAIMTVNVIEDNDGIFGVDSFPDNDEGNKAADKLFREMALKNGAVEGEDDIEELTDCGQYDNGTYHLYIVHSNAEKTF